MARDPQILEDITAALAIRPLSVGPERQIEGCVFNASFPFCSVTPPSDDA
jgi:hypothetical protein